MVSFYFSSVVNVWDWRSTSDYVIDASCVNRLLKFSIKSRESDSEVDELFFARVDGPSDVLVVVEAESFVHQAGALGWSEQAETFAFQWGMMKASSVASGVDPKGTAIYFVRFRAAGSYQ